jgi:iron complex outermembrane receptor protein
MVENSYSRVRNNSLGLSYIGSGGYVGGALREYDTQYGVPGGFVGAHPKGVDIEIFRRHYNVRAAWDMGSGGSNLLSLSLGRTYYHHVELEKSGAVGAEFTIVSYAGIAELAHGNAGPLASGVLGVSVGVRDFSVGGFVFTPPTVSQRFSAFGYEEVAVGRFELQLAARMQYDVVTPEREDPEARIGPIQKRSFWTYSLSGAALYRLFSGWRVGVSVSRSSRVPTIEELYSEGPHLAAYSYEVGNPLLEEERGFGLEVFLRHTGSAVTFSLSAFRYDFSNYILSTNTGDTSFATLLPIYASAGVPALLRGVEGDLEWRVFPSVLFTARVGFTHGENTGTGSPLPVIPPLKGSVALRYAPSTLSAGVSTEFAAAQERVDTFEEPTAGYAIFHGYVQYVLTTGSLLHTVSLMVDNILDQEYRNHLSRIKSILPEAGRNVRLVYKVMI